jgi:hypothetical protein
MNRNSDTGIVPALHRTPLFAAGGRIRVAARFPMGHYRGTTRGRRKDGTIHYRAAQHDCDACILKSKCWPNMLARKIARSVHEAARDKARAIAKTEAYAVSRRERKRSRCSSLIWSASSGSVDCASAV